MESTDSVESNSFLPEKDVAKGKSFLKYLVVILVFLVIILSGVLTFLYVQGALDGLLGKIATQEEEQIEEVEDVITDEVLDLEESDNTIVLSNSGWGLFSLPEYGFSVEIPDYVGYQDFPVNVYGGQEIDKDVPLYWAVKHGDTAFPERYIFDDLYTSLVHHIKVSFYPDRVPLEIACTGCIEEHYIDVYVYRENADFEEVEEIYSGEVSKMTSETDCSGGYSVEEKWDLDVLAYDLNCVGGKLQGYALSSDGYVFLVVSRLVPNSQLDSYKVALKVLDSMKFN